MIDLRATMSNAERVARRIEAARKRAVKAKQTAIKVEAFRLLRELRKEVREGRPGGLAYSEPTLSAIASYTKAGNRKKNLIPLARMAKLLRYNVSGAESLSKFKVEFGFTDTAKSRLSRSYKEILTVQQEGATIAYRGSREERGRRMAKIGAKLKKKGDPNFKYFFLRKDGPGDINLPKRDIINTFWRYNQFDAVENVRKNFERKMRGERI